MPLKTPDAALRRIGKSLSGIAKSGGAGNESLLRAVIQGSRDALAYQFANGVDPYGNSWDRTKQQKQALNSKKLPTGAFKTRLGQNRVWIFDRLPRDWLRAHQEGHTFPARNVGSGGAVSRTKTVRRKDGSTYQRDVRQGLMFFDRKGRLVKHSRGLAREGKNMRFGRAVLARAHRVGQRVLPQRQIFPENGDIPPLWRKPINERMQQALLKSLESVGSLTR